MLGLARLGVGGAFPFSIFAILAAYLLFRKSFDTSLLEDLVATSVAIARSFQAFGHARPRS